MVLEAGALPKLAEFLAHSRDSPLGKRCSQRTVPIADEPLFHNCTLLSVAEPGVDWVFSKRCALQSAERSKDHDPGIAPGMRH